MKQFVLIITLITLSCAPSIPPNNIETHVQDIKYDLIHIIHENNTKLSMFKGIADLKLTNHGRVNSLKIAWASVKPDKIRLEIFKEVFSK